MENTVQDKSSKKNKRKKRKSRLTWVFVIFWAGIIGLAFALMAGQARRYNELREENLIIQENIDRALDRQHQLQLEEEFHDRNAYIERLARERLGFVRPNEIVFRNIAAD